jgi:hypothetical protein
MLRWLKGNSHLNRLRQSLSHGNIDGSVSCAPPIQATKTTRVKHGLILKKFQIEVLRLPDIELYLIDGDREVFDLRCFPALLKTLMFL